MIRRAIILVLAWFGGPMLTAADRPTTTKPSTSQASSGPSEIVIPAGRLDALLTVSVQIADSGPHLLIVDTGASFVILDEALANRLALRPASLRANKALTAGNTQIPLDRAVKIDRLELSEFAAGDVTAAVVDLTFIREATGEPVDGILGLDILADYLITLDYETPALRLSRGVLPEADGRDILPMYLFAGVPIAAVRMGKIDIEVVVDSGSNCGLSFPSTVQKELRFAVEPVPVSVATTAGGVKSRMAGRLAGPISIGRHVFEQPVLELSDGLPNLGGDVLQKFAVTLDIHSGRIRFSRRGADRIPPSPYRATGLSMSRRSSGWIVNGVVAKSPAAAAGIRPGDALMSYDGRPAEGLTLARWRALFRSTDEIRCRFQRGDDTYDVALREAILLPVIE